MSTRLIGRSIGLSALLVLLVSGSAAAQQVSPPTAQSSPRAVVPFTSYDFGDVYRGEPIRQLFVVRNEGDANLIIKGVEPGCNCEIVEADQVILPGKEGTVQIEVNTSSSIGPLIKIVTLKTNNPEQPHMRLTLTANVLANSDGGPANAANPRQGKHVGPLFVAPDDGWSGLLSAGEKGTTEFIVTVREGPMKLLHFEAGSEHFEGRIETLAAGKSYKLVVGVLPMKEPGTYTETLKVITDSSLLPYLLIKMRVRVKE
jgi:hypothetical protein